MRWMKVFDPPRSLPALVLLGGSALCICVGLLGCRAVHHPAGETSRTCLMWTTVCVCVCMASLTSPPREHCFFIMTKTAYMGECKRLGIPIQPTEIITTDTDLAAAAAAIHTMSLPEGKFVTKLNFSASAEEVNVHEFTTEQDIFAVLHRLQQKVQFSLHAQIALNV